MPHTGFQPSLACVVVCIDMGHNGRLPARTARVGFQLSLACSTFFHFCRAASTLRMALLYVVSFEHAVTTPLGQTHIKPLPPSFCRGILILGLACNVVGGPHTASRKMIVCDMHMACIDFITLLCLSPPMDLSINHRIPLDSKSHVWKREC